MKRLTLGLAALFLSASMAGIAAKPGAKPAAKKPAAVMYKAACGMTYTAAQAKKYNYICPMDKKRLVKVTPKAKKAKAAAKPGAHKNH